MRIEYAVAFVASILVAWAAYDVHKNRDNLIYIYMPAPTIGSVRPPPLQATAPITNTQGSPWLGGNNSPSWTFGS
jgi:hypothetical protein